MIKEIKPMDPLIRKLLPPQSPRPGTVYRPSQFVLKADGLLWNTLTQQCLEAELPETAQAGEGLDDLIRGCFLVPETRDECRFYQSLFALVRACQKKKGVRGYTILPTLACNARCVYCYEQGMPQTSMSPETADQVFRYILATHGPEPVRIDWFGGEPLLRPDILDQICEGLTKAGVPYQSTMISNGSLVTPELIGKMTGLWRMDRIQISMDGAEADYVKRKRYLQKQDDYHKVLSAVSQMGRAGIRVTVRVNVDQENLDGLSAFLRDLDNAVTEKQFVSVYFCPLNEVRMGSGDLAVWTRLQGIQADFRTAGFNVSASLLGDGRFRAFHCIADSGNVVICPDGSLYACEHCPQEARIGDIWNGVTDTAARDAFCRTDRVRDNCCTCPYLPLCTPFAACPVKDTHCREIRDLQVAALLQEMRRGTPHEQNTQLC